MIWLAFVAGLVIGARRLRQAARIPCGLSYILEITPTAPRRPIAVVYLSAGSCRGLFMVGWSNGGPTLLLARHDWQWQWNPTLVRGGV